MSAGLRLLPRGTWAVVIPAWAASRVLFLVTGAIGAHALKQATPLGFPREPPGWLNYWANWDGGWYSSIATVGYRRTLWPASANFFPMYPMALRAGRLLGASVASWGVAVSILGFLLALYFLYELAESCVGTAAARAAAVTFAFFPTAFFFNAVYSEGLFLAAAVGAVWAARVRGNLLLAGVLGCVAAATRNVGVFLLLPLGHEWLRRREDVGWRGLAPLTLLPAGLAAYMLWLWRWGGQPLLFATVARRTWGRGLASPVHTLDGAWHAAREGATWAVHPSSVFASTSPNPSFGAMATFNLALFVLLALLLLGTIVRVPAGLAAYAVLSAAVPFLTPAHVSPLASMPRYFLAAFPVFLYLGTLLARRRALLVGWVAASTALGILLTLYFTTWRWVA